MKREIIELYADDFRKIDPTGKATRLFYAIPGQLSLNASRYQVSSVIAKEKHDRIAELLQDMEDSKVVLFSRHANDPSVGLALHEDMDQYKMFVCDTGLFVTLAFWDKSVTENTIYQKLLSDKLSADLGYVYENMVAQMLVAAGNRLFYHTWPTESGKHNYEIDFLLSRGNKLWPLEVKSSGYKSHMSLDKFCEKYSEWVSNRYLIYTKDLRREELAILDEKIDKDKEENHALLEQRAELLDDIEKKERIRKAAMVQEKDLEYNDLKQILSVKSGYTPLDKINVPIPKIDTPPMFNKDKWAEEQNNMIRQTFREGYQKIINQLSEDAQKHVNRAQAQAAMRIEEHIKSHREEDMKLRTTILRQNYQLQAERQPDKTLLTEVNLWEIGEGHHRMSGRYCSIPFTLSLTSEMERALDYGLSNFEIAAAFLPEIFATCYDVDPDLAEQPEVRDSIVTAFLKLVDSATTPTESLGGGGNSQGGWRDKNKEEDLRKKIFDVACSRISRRGGFRR